ncbi:MAG: transcription elongation factor GreA [Ruminococcaceae bacterium]|nr:transcription elongation factor GreA [Oscillospiraceae bacterium]
MSNQLVVTNEGLQRLNEEYEHLKNVRRQEITEAIRLALSFGDLSENSEYSEAKEEQAKVESRIQELEEMLKNVRVIDDSEVHTDSVNIGAKVRVADLTHGGTETEYNLVGSTEADPMAAKISDQSPIGKAIIGARVGDKVTVNTPGGEVVLEILEISK